MKHFSIETLSVILRLNSTAIMSLVNSGKIPYKVIKADGCDIIRFNPAEIKQWIPWGASKSMTDDEEYIAAYTAEIEQEFGEELKKLREFGSQFADPWKPKRYYLEAVKNKKLGFVYYVKYLKDGKLVPSKWTTGTNNKEIAERFAVENRERLLAAYFSRDTVKKPYADLYIIFRKYYSENSPYLEVDRKKGRELGEEARALHHGFLINQFIPYLKKQRVKEIEEIDTPFMSRFRNYLMAERTVKGKKRAGMKPQSVKQKISLISIVFDHLLEEGLVKTNPCKSLRSIKARKEDQKITGCYKAEELKGVFNKRWKNQLSYLLSLIMYTTNMSNREIERMQMSDIIELGGVKFIDIPKGKSKNRERIVPLHPFVYRKITAYANKNGTASGGFIFKSPDKGNMNSRVYRKAARELGSLIGYTEEKMKQENMRFYSGRHFWKSLMSGNGLGTDIEEVFMGHQVTNDVKERYNHRNKHGEELKVEKAKQSFAILDKWVFA